MTDKQAHRKLLQDKYMDLNPKLAHTIHIPEQQRDKNRAQSPLTPSSDVADSLLGGLHFRTVLLCDGFVELLADKVVCTRANTDCETQLGIVVFKPSDEGIGQANAVDEGVRVPDVFAGLLIEGFAQKDGRFVWGIFEMR